MGTAKSCSRSIHDKRVENNPSRQAQSLIQIRQTTMPPLLDRPFVSGSNPNTDLEQISDRSSQREGKGHANDDGARDAAVRKPPEVEIDSGENSEDAYSWSSSPEGVRAKANGPSQDKAEKESYRHAAQKMNYVTQSHSRGGSDAYAEIHGDADIDGDCSKLLSHTPRRLMGSDESDLEEIFMTHPQRLALQRSQHEAKRSAGASEPVTESSGVNGHVSLQADTTDGTFVHYPRLQPFETGRNDEIIKPKFLSSLAEPQKSLRLDTNTHHFSSDSDSGPSPTSEEAEEMRAEVYRQKTDSPSEMVQDYVMRQAAESNAMGNILSIGETSPKSTIEESLHRPIVIHEDAVIPPSWNSQIKAIPHEVVDDHEKTSTSPTRNKPGATRQQTRAFYHVEASSDAEPEMESEAPRRLKKKRPTARKMASKSIPLPSRDLNRQIIQSTSSTWMCSQASAPDIRIEPIVQVDRTPLNVGKERSQHVRPDSDIPSFVPASNPITGKVPIAKRATSGPDTSRSSHADAASEPIGPLSMSETERNKALASSFGPRKPTSRVSASSSDVRYEREPLPPMGVIIDHNEYVGRRTPGSPKRRPLEQDEISAVNEPGSKRLRVASTELPSLSTQDRVTVDPAEASRQARKEFMEKARIERAQVAKAGHPEGSLFSDKPSTPSQPRPPATSEMGPSREESLVEITLYERFRQVYPAYTAPQSHFEKMCQDIRVEAATGKLWRLLWDDFVIQHYLRYLPTHVDDCVRKNEQPKSYTQWYQDEIEKVQYHEAVLKPATIGSKDALGLKAKPVQQEVHEKTEKPATIGNADLSKQEARPDQQEANEKGEAPANGEEGRTFQEEALPDANELHSSRATLRPSQVRTSQSREVLRSNGEKHSTNVPTNHVSTPSARTLPWEGPGVQQRPISKPLPTPLQRHPTPQQSAAPSTSTPNSSAPTKGKAKPARKSIIFSEVWKEHNEKEKRS